MLYFDGCPIFFLDSGFSFRRKLEFFIFFSVLLILGLGKSF